MAEAVRSGHVSGNGPFSHRCTEHLERGLEASRVLLTHSGTGALEMAAILAGVGPGDEVVMPSFTFPSVANAFVLRGATPVFVDVREDTLNLDERLIEPALSSRTRAIVPVHYGGIGCAMGPIGELAADRDLALVEDAAQAYGCTWSGRKLGTFGHAAAISFHETKNVISGEGGALIVNEPGWVERAEILHEKGTNRAAFFRGEIDKYTWVDIGSSFLASDLQAAFLLAQLERAEEIAAARMAIWNDYHRGFEALESKGVLRRPIIPPEAMHAGHVYHLLMPSNEQRDRVLAELKDRGIGAVIHYVPLHSSPAGVRYGRVSGSMQVTDSVSACLLRLPLWIGMDRTHVDAVVAAVSEAAALAAT